MQDPDNQQRRDEDAGRVDGTDEAGNEAPAAAATLDTAFAAFTDGLGAGRELLLASTELAAAEARQAIGSAIVLVAALLLLVVFLPGLWVLLLALFTSLLRDAGWSLGGALTLLVALHLVGSAVLVVIILWMLRRMRFRHTREGLAAMFSSRDDDHAGVASHHERTDDPDNSMNETRPAGSESVTSGEAP
ncbi:MAG: hypothetical protein CSB44_08245 [Gammaproteobacteria bacterium]|nr:MAG: hypothetical protein CSB44_08245 [Gammaproteobacteria bacterium]